MDFLFSGQDILASGTEDIQGNQDYSNDWKTPPIKVMIFYLSLLRGLGLGEKKNCRYLCGLIAKKKKKKD